MRLPIKYELFFMGKDIQAAFNIGLDQFPVETRQKIELFYKSIRQLRFGLGMTLPLDTRRKAIELTKRLNEYLKYRGINAIEIDGGLNGVNWYLPPFDPEEEPEDMLFFEFKVLELGKTPRQLYIEAKKSLAYITYYIFSEIFPSEGIPYRVIDDIGTYMAILRNMNPIKGENSDYEYVDFEAVVTGEVQLEPGSTTQIVNGVVSLLKF